jgi:hypothetical protein
MCLDDGAANSQAHAHSVLFRCKEGLEGFFRILESGSAIPYLHDSAIGPLPCRTDKDCLGVVHNLIHCLDSIEDQVENDLLQLYPIGHHGWKFLVQIGFHSDAPFSCIASQEAEHLTDDFIQVEDVHLTGSSPEKRSDTPHNFSGILAIANDSFGRLAHLGQVRRIR